MPEYLAPGVFIEEFARGPKPIEGVSTSTAAFIGETERGPLRPRLVTAYNEYLRLYGTVFDDDKYMPFGVKAFFDNGGELVYIARLVGTGADTASSDIKAYEITAIGPGAFGNRIYARILASTTEQPNAAGDALEPIGFRLQVAYWSRDVPGGLFDPFCEDNENQLSQPQPSLVEDFDDLSLDPESANYWRKIITDTTSALIRLRVPDNLAAIRPTADDVFGAPLMGGADGGALTSAQFDGMIDEAGSAIDDSQNYRGLAALNLDVYRDIAIVHAPGIGNDDDTTRAIQLAIVNHCERNRFRFAVLDSARGLNTISDERLLPRNTIDTQYGAFYYPWYHTPNPSNGVKTLIPPGAAACGIYALTGSRRVEKVVERSSRLTPVPITLAIGLVAMTGRVVEHESCYRAVLVEVLALAFVTGAVV